METLQETLEKIEGLQHKTSSAEVVVKEAVTHEEEYGHMEPFAYGTHTVVDEPEVRKPDFKARKEAMEELKKIYLGSEWCSARCVAENALGKKTASDVTFWHVGLEESMKKVENLREDARAYRILQPEVSHWDIRNLMVEPDIEKIEKARLELKEVYLHSEWYSARYAAGSLIGKDTEKEINTWCADLEKRLWELKTEEQGVKYDCGDWNSNLEIFCHWKPVAKTCLFVDKETRYKALSDLVKLFELSRSERASELLRKVDDYFPDYPSSDVYENIDKNGNPANGRFTRMMRNTAGKALGYSKFKIWKHQHPVAAVATAVAAVGAASGLIYAIAEYFVNK